MTVVKLNLLCNMKSQHNDCSKIKPAVQHEITTQWLNCSKIKPAVQHEVTIQWLNCSKIKPAVQHEVTTQWLNCSKIKPAVQHEVTIQCCSSFFRVVFLFCLSSPCTLCTQCCPCLWIVHSWLLLRFSLTLIYYLLCPVPCVPNVTSISGLSILEYSFGFL